MFSLRSFEELEKLEVKKKRFSSYFYGRSVKRIFVKRLSSTKYLQSKEGVEDC